MLFCESWDFFYFIIILCYGSWDDQWEHRVAQLWGDTGGCGAPGSSLTICPAPHLSKHCLSCQVNWAGLGTPALSACPLALLAPCRARGGRLRPQSPFCNAAVSLKQLDVSSAARSLFLDTRFSAFPALRPSHCSLTGLWFLSG